MIGHLLGIFSGSPTREQTSNLARQDEPDSFVRIRMLQSGVSAGQEAKELELPA
jgi:hypothetical protein